MRVVIDATVVSRRLKGAGRVVKNLLVALPTVDPETQYIALAWPEGAHVLRQAGIEGILEVPESNGSSWELHSLGQRAKSEDADLVLTLREVVGFGGPPTILHVNEPPAYRLRAGFGGRSVKHVFKDGLLQAMLRGSVRRAALVTAASRETAGWLRNRYGLESPVIPPGIDPIFLQKVTPSAFHAYFLHPATGDRRDNSDLVLRAFALLRTKDIRLALIGTTSSERERLNGRAQAAGVAERVDFIGWVSDEELRDLYCGAIALVHPSRYEGFAGLQPLEAMAQGTPVIALHAPGTAEVLEGAAELVRTEDPEELADAMRRLASDEVHRASLSAVAHVRVRDLTWERAAERFVEVFETV